MDKMTESRILAPKAQLIKVAYYKCAFPDLWEDQVPWRNNPDWNPERNLADSFKVLFRLRGEITWCPQKNPTWVKVKMMCTKTMRFSCHVTSINPAKDPLCELYLMDAIFNCAADLGSNYVKEFGFN